MTKLLEHQPGLSAWRNSRAVKLVGIGVLVAVVVVRLAVLVYWSLGDISYALSDWRTVLQLVLMLIILVMLSRFAWQVWARRD